MTFFTVTVPDTVARGPVPRDRPVDRRMARDRPSPYGEGGVFFIGARGPALREGTAFFPHREAYHLNVEQFMKHPHFMWRQKDEILDAFVSRPLADK